MARTAPPDRCPPAEADEAIVQALHLQKLPGLLMIDEGEVVAPTPAVRVALSAEVRIVRG